MQFLAFCSVLDLSAVIVAPAAAPSSVPKIKPTGGKTIDPSIAPVEAKDKLEDT